VVGYDENSLYLYCSGQDMPCGKEQYIEVEEPTNPEFIEKICKNILDDKLFGFCQVDIQVPKHLKEKFSEFSPLFVVDTIPEELVPEHMKKYQEDTGRKTLKGTKKLLGVCKAEKILLYTPMLKWYLKHGLEITTIHKILKYTLGRPFQWFPEEVSNARRDGDNNPALKQLGDTYKLKGNSFYGKMIEDLEKHTKTSYTQNESDVDKAFRSPFFDDLDVINETYELKERKRQVNINRPYQCGIAVYQLAKLRMLEFYYDFLDKYVDRRDFELIQMDTDSMYMALSAKELDDLIKPELKDEYFDSGKAKFLSTSKYHDRTPGLCKAEFKGTRMIALTCKCYYAEDTEMKPKFSCKGVSQKQNVMSWDRYKGALDGFKDKAQNTGFRVNDNQIVTYTQNKLGLSAYYDKRIVAADGIHTKPLY
jgi:hypothetical protein